MRHYSHSFCCRTEAAGTFPDVKNGRPEGLVARWEELTWANPRALLTLSQMAKCGGVLGQVSGQERTAEKVPPGAPVAQLVSVRYLYEEVPPVLLSYVHTYLKT